MNTLNTHHRFQDGESQLLIVVPPGSLSSNRHVIRILQVSVVTVVQTSAVWLERRSSLLQEHNQCKHTIVAVQVGPGTCSTPNGRYLLYISTRAMSGSTARDSLSAAVEVLLQCPQALVNRDTDTASIASAIETASEPATQTAGGSQALLGSPATAVHIARGLVDVRPRALLVAYYVQECRKDAEVRSTPLRDVDRLLNHSGIAGTCTLIAAHFGPEAVQEDLPLNIASCNPPDGTLDFASALTAAVDSFKRLLPGVDPPFMSILSPGGAPCLRC